MDSLFEQIHRGALFVGDELLPGFRREDAIELTRGFAAQLPSVRGVLINDLPTDDDGNVIKGDLIEVADAFGFGRADQKLVKVILPTSC